MTTDEQLKSAQLNYTRAGVVIINVIQEMERELQRMKDKKLSQDFIDAKDQQIQDLVNYYNMVDELVQFYRLMNLNLKIQLTEACQYIVKTATQDKVQQEYLMTYLNNHAIKPKPINGEDPQA